MRFVVDGCLDLDEQFDLLLDTGNLMLKVDVLHFHHATEGVLEQANVVITFSVLLDRLFYHRDGVDFLFHALYKVWIYEERCRLSFG